MRPTLELPTHRFVRIATLALIGGVATCVDQPIPTSSLDPEIADSIPTAALVPAGITHTLLTAGNDVVNQKIYTTAPISPAPNTLITVAVMGHTSFDAAPSPKVTGGGMTTWTEVTTISFDTVAAPHKRLTIYRAMSPAPGSGPLTITFSVTEANCQWIVSQWDGVDLTGTNGAGAIGQTGATRADGANGLTVTLGAFGSAGNVAYGVFGVKKNALAVTPGAGFTQIAQQPSNEGTVADLAAEWAPNDNSIDASWTKLNAGALGVEIKAANGGSGVSASQSTVAASSGSISADSGQATITVTAKDASGNPISGATVVLSATGTGNTVTQPAGPTGADGVATGALRSTVAQAKVVSATIDGTLITQTATVSVTPGAVSASRSTVAASPTSIPPGSGTSTITVTAKDANGNPISGAGVVLAATGSGTALTQPAAPTDSGGLATGTLSSTAEQAVTVSATIAGTAITQTATVQVTAQTPSTITHTLLTAGNDVVNQKIYTTAPISPAPNTLITVAVMGHTSFDVAPSPKVSGGGMAAWTEVVSTTFDAVAAPHKRLTVYRAMSPAPGSGPLTITFSVTEANCQWIVSQWDGVDQSGANGASAIGQTGTARADGGNGLVVALGAFGSAANAAYGVFGVKKNALAITPGAGFTQIAQQPSNEGTIADLAAEWATNDNTIDARWTNLSAGALGVEIKAGTGGGTPPPPVASVEVTPASATVTVGGTVQLSAVAREAGGEPLTGRTITWATSAPQIATVSAAGLVTGVAAGAATITATSEGKSGTASVTVTASTEPVATVEVTPEAASVVVGGTVQLTATPKDAAGQPLTGRAVTWATDASQVATVSAAGLVRGVAAGAATITATSEGKNGTASVTVTSQPLSTLAGQWSSVIPAPIVQLHLHLLLDGRVLSWGHNGNPQVWDPATSGFTAVPSPSLMFCAGHDFLPDGRLLVAGGHISDSHGLPNTNIFDPASGSWQAGAPMAKGRWYPTVTTLASGELLVMAGTDQNGAVVTIPEVWNGASWRQLTSASLSLSNYPRTFVAPDGRIFYAGDQQQSRYLDATGAGSWTTGPLMKYGARSYGSAVMYEPGKILFVGGHSPPTNTAEIIDLNQPSPQWTYTGSMAYARWNLNATLLPTGDVLVTGGTSDGNRANTAGAVYVAELWNATSGVWTQMASNAVFRGYHSTTLLLPDGRVLHTGGGDGGGVPNNLNYELYSPPYLFNGARPVVTGATPGTVGYGQALSVGTPDGADITKVTLIRLGSVTHAFNPGQTLVPLAFSPVSGGLSVTLPASHTTAPPGPYMLFLVNGNGVPSIGRIMLLR